MSAARADLLTERKRWYSYFPEGTLEFLVITRVLALLLLGALILVPSSQRPAVLVALAAIVWLDYALVLWWLMQVAGDLNRLFARSTLDRPVTDPGIRNMLLALLPSVLIFLAVAPWPSLVLGRGEATARLASFLQPGLAIAALVALPLGYRALQTYGLSGGLRTLLLLIPIVHWFALHRLLAPLHARVREGAIAEGLPVSQETGAGAAAGAADVLLLISAVFWIAWAVLLGSGRIGALLALAQGGALAAGSLFAITQVAALEYLQRRFATLIRRSRSIRPAGIEED
jgi:hypothetical protein